MTVARALELPPLRDGLPEVLAGHESLGRPIRWVHSSEVDNIADLLRGGELLLTTGMRICDEPRAVRLVDQLGERGVAGLVVELGGALPLIPPRMIERASSSGLPLVCLHREVAFVDVTEAIHSEIVSHQLSVLLRTQAVHSRFTRLMMSGGTPQSILETLAGVVANPVVLEDADGSLVYHARYAASDSDVLSAWERLDVAPSEVPVLAVPLPGNRVTGGRLLVLGLDSDLDELASSAARRAAELVTLASMRTSHEQTLALEERGRFLDQLASEHFEPREAAAQARRLGFEPAGQLLMPVVVALKRPAGDATAGKRSAGSLWRYIRRELGGAGVEGLAGIAPEADALLLLVAVADERRRRAVADQLAAISHRAASRTRVDSGAISVGVGVVTDWAGVGLALASARKTAAAPRNGQPDGWRDAARPDIDRLLRALASRDEAVRYVARRMGSLLDGSPRNQKLHETLAAYSGASGRVSMAAARLRLGRQALYHRLASIEDVLDADLGDEDTRLGIDLALRLLPYIESESSRVEPTRGATPEAIGG